MSSTQVVALVFWYGFNIVWYCGIRFAYWDHEEK